MTAIQASRKPRSHFGGQTSTRDVTSAEAAELLQSDNSGLTCNARSRKHLSVRACLSGTSKRLDVIVGGQTAARFLTSVGTRQLPPGGSKDSLRCSAPI